MDKEHGNKKYPIWLLGDSEPANWRNDLKYPFDPRHPAIHNIWTPIIDKVQEEVFKAKKRRIDTTDIYVRNAVDDPDRKPKRNKLDWSPYVQTKQNELERLIKRYKPKIIFTFGSFSFEMCRRALNETPNRKYGYFWTTQQLSNQFHDRIELYNHNQTNIIPLLHISISQRHYLVSHRIYTDNPTGCYFDYSGKLISEIILRHFLAEDIWV